MRLEPAGDRAQILLRQPESQPELGGRQPVMIIRGVGIVKLIDQRVNRFFLLRGVLQL